MRREPKSLRDLPISEAMVQQAIVAYLEAHHMTVLVTNVSVRGAAIAAGRKVGPVCSPGVPDLLVTCDGWPEGSWLGLEVKRPKGKLSAEQQVLEAHGRIVVVRSIDDAVDAVKAHTRHLHVWRDPFFV